MAKPGGGNAMAAQQAMQQNPDIAARLQNAGNQMQVAQQRMQRPPIPGLAGPNAMPQMPPRFDVTGAQPAQQNAITANMPMRGPMNDPRMRSIGGMNPVAQAIQQQGANPAQANTVMNRLKPTMDSNQNVPPLQSSNPNMAPRPGGMFTPFRRFGG